MKKIFLEFLKDKRAAIDPLTLTALGLSGGGTLLGAFSKNKKKTPIEPFPGYYSGVQDVLKTARAKMNTPGKTSGLDFNLDPSDTALATEGAVLGRIKNPKNFVQDTKAVTERSYAAQKARLAGTYDDEQKKLRESYNRLGLSSSTPYLQASGDLSRKQAIDEEAISAELAQKDIDRELDAMKYGEDLNQRYLTMGQILGQQDFGNQQYTLGSKYQDFARAEEEPLRWAQLASGVLGGGSPYYQQEEPGIGAELGMAGQDIGTMMLMLQILGQKK